MSSPPYDLAQTPELPVVYKKSIILFRTLYSYLALMPSWKFRRRLSKLKLHSSALKIGCRVQSGDDFAKSGRRWDGLQVPLLHGDEKATEEFEFGKVESPAGSFSISVEYRSNCDFRVDDSESLLSSHFINLDEHYFHPPSRQRPISQPSTFAGRATEPGSLPLSALPQRPDYAGATYGSLSSFHQAGGLTGASPISTLRAAATEMNRSSSNSSLDHPPSRLQSIQGSKSSLRGSSDIPMSRRGSISFQPFKSPSLSASPANPDGFVGSMGRAGTPSSQPRPSRMGNAGVSPSSHRSSNSTVTPTGEATQSPIPITSSSPKPQPMTRIASSFGSRRPRVSSGASLTREDDNSSGQASYTSSMAAPGSGVYAAAGTSSYEEDLQIRDFMSMLADGQRTSLKSFGGGGASSGESSIRNTGNPLSKFQRMKDSQSALADSMSSSLLLQPSSSTSNSSRNLSGVPGMVTSTTFSSSSSPGKPLSPHTPHTPAIPSRLSEGLTAQYTTDRQRHSRPTASDNRRYSQPGRVAEGTATTSPLDIPLSPRFIGPRRANSNSQQQHEEAIESGESGDFEPVTSFNNRLQSSGDAPLSRSRLQDLHNASQSALPGREAAEAGSRQDDDEDDDGLAFRRVGPPPIDTAEEEPPRLASRFHRGTPSSSYRGRFPRNRADTPTTGSTSSLEKNSQTGSSGSNARTNVGRRTPSWSRPGQGHEDEDLLFAMSDMMVAQQSRRSLDQPEKPGGSDSATSSGRRRSRGGSGAGDSGRGGGGWLVG